MRTTKFTATTLGASDADATTAAPRLAPPAASRPLEIGDHFGPYRIDAAIGAGGMGLVYRATQLEPVTRTVALKLMRNEFRDELGYAMFLVERQALAGLDHTYIARVFDAGQHVAGALYFAMEWIEGAMLDRWCREQAAGVEGVLAMLVKVCRGIGHAHARGVVHRDIKPGNILVQTVDGQALPRIIDFGIAITGDERAAAVSGTLGYMSPEQAAGGGSDARTDVYALGVLTCHLLAARTGADIEPWWSLPASERQQWVLEPPSWLPAAFVRALGTDLRAVIARAIDPDPDRRHADASALAEDLQACIDGYPVSARERTRSYVLARFMARHRWAMSLSAVVLSALLGLAVYAWTGWQRADEQRLEADQTAVFLRSLLGSLRPEYAMGLDQSLMNKVLEDARQRLDHELTASPRVRSALAETIAGAYLGLGDAKAALAVIEAVRGDASTRFGADSDLVLDLDVRRVKALRMDGQAAAGEDLAGDLFQRLGRVRGPGHESTLEVAEALIRGRFDRGELESARAFGEQVLAEADAGSASALGRVTVQAALAVVYARQGQSERAIELLQAAITSSAGEDDTSLLTRIALQGELGATLALSNRYAEAAVQYEAMLPAYERIYGANHAYTLTLRGNLAGLLMRSDPAAAAVRLAELHRIQTELLGAAHPDTVSTLGNQAAALMRAGDAESAVPILQAFLRFCKVEDGAVSATCAERRFGLGKMFRALARYAEAEAEMLAAFEQKQGRETGHFNSTAAVASELAALYRDWAKPDRAAIWEERARQEVR